VMMRVFIWSTWSSKPKTKTQSNSSKMH